jgi:hypothetical protein
VTASPRRSQIALLVTLSGALVALSAAPGVHAARAASYTSCSLAERDRDPPGDTPTYNLTLKRAGPVSCATAKKVVRSFHRCRARSSATCTKRLLGHWRCAGRKESSIPTQFYGSFTCTYAGRRVTSSYEQAT